MLIKWGLKGGKKEEKMLSQPFVKRAFFFPYLWENLTVIPNLIQLLGGKAIKQISVYMKAYTTARSIVFRVAFGNTVFTR